MIEFDSDFEKRDIPQGTTLECHVTFPQLMGPEIKQAQECGFKLSATSPEENWSYLTAHAKTREELRTKLGALLSTLPRENVIRVKVEAIVFDTKQGDRLPF